MKDDKTPLRVYVGWDSREDIAFQVCKASILKHASVPVEIIPLKQKRLRKADIYTRPEDMLASTEFTFTRFLVPYLCDYEGWALFIDCDFVFTDDIAKLFGQSKDKYALMCAKHDYKPKAGKKMDGKTQHVYPRKNWSSMMLINCGHPSNKRLSLKYINNENTTGAHLHRFTWLSDQEIGSISHEWNWLVGWYKEPADGTPRALHYTEGGPWFSDYEDCEYNGLWYKYKNYYLENELEKARKLDEKFTSVFNLHYTDSKKELLQSVLNYIVDPDGNYYNINKEKLDELLEIEMGNKVCAIDSAGGVGYANKGHAYDTYLTAFVLGSTGRISDWTTVEKQTGTNPLVIRGLGGGSRKAIHHCWNTGRNFYAIDTGYFGNHKHKEYHRVTKNALQDMGPIIPREGDRLKKLGWNFRAFTPGRKILLCPPSQKVMDIFGQPSPQEWVDSTIAELKKYTDRPIEVRLKPNRSERVTTKTMDQALADNVHCLITYNSIAATEAILLGKPAIAVGPNAAQVICNTKLSEVEALKIPSKDEVVAFARHLSYCQFTYKELQDGTAWRIVNESR